MSIEEIAQAHNAYTKTDHEGDVAICRRLYNAEGIEQVRHAPCRGDFLTKRQWINGSPEEVAHWVC